mmetsp:Transcript_9595/g.15442  ORF Transcript_9595/g.15442 Transcript_9595/m.15442 type:complete len:162 (-) Transcript_9595:256-741(-)
MRILYIGVVIYVLQLLLLRAQVDCSCGSSPTEWRCTSKNGTQYQGGEDGYSQCVSSRSDIWESQVNCVYCYKCTGNAGLGECECDERQNCSDVFVIVGIILIILGIIFLIWQGFILWRFYVADGECKDVWKICGCFIIGLICLIIGILMVADQALWFGAFS